LRFVDMFFFRDDCLTLSSFPNIISHWK